MNEAIEEVVNTVEERPRSFTELVAEEEAKAKSYPLDQEEITIELADDDEIIYSHKFKRPTLDQLIEREKEAAFEGEEIRKNEERYRQDQDRSDTHLWDEIILEIKGYEFDESLGLNVDPEVWTPVTKDIAPHMPVGHKVEAIKSTYESNYEVLSEKKRIVLGGQSYKVLQKYKDYEILHTFRAPTEAEARYYRKNANATSFVRETKHSRRAKMKTRSYTDLSVQVQIYNSLIKNINGVTADGASSNYTQLINPLWKSEAVDCFLSFFNRVASRSKKS